MNINCVVSLKVNVDKSTSIHLQVKKGDWNSTYSGEFSQFTLFAVIIL